MVNTNYLFKIVSFETFVNHIVDLLLRQSITLNDLLNDKDIWTSVQVFHIAVLPIRK
jgi:hypothetical protein